MNVVCRYLVTQGTALLEFKYDDGLCITQYFNKGEDTNICLTGFYEEGFSLDGPSDSDYFRYLFKDLNLISTIVKRY